MHYIYNKGVLLVITNDKKLIDYFKEQEYINDDIIIRVS